MNIPKYSKLFIQIVRETSVLESDCPGNVRYPWMECGISSCRRAILLILKSTPIHRHLKSSLSFVTLTFGTWSLRSWVASPDDGQTDGRSGNDTSQRCSYSETLIGSHR